MPILSGSRHEGVPYTGIKTTDGKIRKFLHDRRVYSQEDVGENAIEHIVQGEETLDSLADRYYNDDTLWWLLADVNNIFFAFDLEPGQTLTIPDPSILADLGIR